MMPLTSSVGIGSKWDIYEYIAISQADKQPSCCRMQEAP